MNKISIQRYLKTLHIKLSFCNYYQSLAYVNVCKCKLSSNVDLKCLKLYTTKTISENIIFFFLEIVKKFKNDLRANCIN